VLGLQGRGTNHHKLPLMETSKVVSVVSKKQRITGKVSLEELNESELLMKHR
jgi:hypothetical protein